jgi:hypothetical protein
LSDSIAPLAQKKASKPWPTEVIAWSGGQSRWLTAKTQEASGEYAQKASVGHRGEGRGAPKIKPTVYLLLLLLIFVLPSGNVRRQ